MASHFAPILVTHCCVTNHPQIYSDLKQQFNTISHSSVDWPYSGGSCSVSLMPFNQKASVHGARDIGLQDGWQVTLVIWDSWLECVNVVSPYDLGWVPKGSISRERKWKPSVLLLASPRIGRATSTRSTGQSSHRATKIHRVRGIDFTSSWSRHAFRDKMKW